MEIKQAIEIAELWEDGKMVGGNKSEVVSALLQEVKRLSPPVDMELIKALEEVTYCDLLGDLIRYSRFKTELEAQEKYPATTMDLAFAAMDAADECPVCLHRFVMGSGCHADGCAFEALLLDRGIDPRR